MTLALKQMPMKGLETMKHLFHLGRSTVKMLLVLSLLCMKVHFYFLCLNSLRHSHANFFSPFHMQLFVLLLSSSYRLKS